MMAALRGVLLGLVLVFSSTAWFAASAQERDYDVDLFHDELAPHGAWLEHPRWGNAWRPRVDRDWRPYSRALDSDRRARLVLGGGGAVGLGRVPLRSLGARRRRGIDLDSRDRVGTRLGRLAPA